MISIEDKKECCGCTACASICSHEAITMEPDALGFLYPKIDTNKCVGCGLCDRVCAFNNSYDTSLNLPHPKVIGARHKDVDEVMNSRSGAVFVALSDYIIESGGVVYGAAFNKDFQVVHKRATSKEQRDSFRGSKYVQSDLRGIFRMIKKDLVEGRSVMFVGTGCQVAGLSSYIGHKLRSKLILIDIVCHGVPAPYIWRDYIRHIEQERGEKVVHVDFRNKKKYGWAAHRETYLFSNSSHEVDAKSYFYRSVFFRKSCGNCYFCNTERPSDITLADFWGWDKAGFTINEDNKGLNLVLINTPKGEKLFGEVSHLLHYRYVTDKSYLQPNLCRPTQLHPFSCIMERDYKNKGFHYVFSHDYDCPTLMDRIRRKFYNNKK